MINASYTLHDIINTDRMETLQLKQKPVTSPFIQHEESKVSSNNAIV
jgi:hypothetical protein